MATDISVAPVETAPATPAPATAPAAPDTSASSAVETPSSSAPQSIEDADREFREFYNPTPTANADVEKTEEPAKTGEENPTEQHPGADQPAAAKAPVEEDPATEAPTQIRPRLHDPEDIAIASLAKARGIKLSEAAAILAPKGASPDIPGVTSEQQRQRATPSATQDLQSRVDALAAEIETAEQGDDYLNADHFKKVRQLAGLESDLKLAKYQESQEAAVRAQSEASAAGQALADNVAAVRRDWPSIADGNSPLGKASNDVIAEWTADPAKQARLTIPEAAKLVAAEAVQRTALDLFTSGKFATLDLAIDSLKAAAPAPAQPAPKAPVPLSSPAPAQQPQPRRVAPVPGSRSQTTDSQPSTFGEAVAAANDPDAVDALLKEAYSAGKTMPLGVR